MGGAECNELCLGMKSTEQQIDTQLNNIKRKAMEACIKTSRAWGIRTIGDRYNAKYVSSLGLKARPCKMSMPVPWKDLEKEKA
jgi:hypothetical protein